MMKTMQALFLVKKRLERLKSDKLATTSDLSDGCLDLFQVAIDVLLLSCEISIIRKIGRRLKHNSRKPKDLVKKVLVDHRALVLTVEPVSSLN